LESGLSRIELVSGNRHFRVRDAFLLTSDKTCLFYFGQSSSVQIPNYIETIGPWAFAHKSFIISVFFGPRQTVRFIREAAFERCEGLQSLCLPSSVREIGESAFAGCSRLSALTFEPNCQLTRIEKQALSGCSALCSFCVPSSVEFVGRRCFSQCGQLATLSFAIPSHLRELYSLPTGAMSSVDIPDSVEVLRTTLGRGSYRLTISFGQESNVKEATFVDWFGGTGKPAFVRLPANRLKILRDSQEFREDLFVLPL
jgi:hypothetical protein